jgi:Eukaryotic cytochrome b561
MMIMKLLSISSLLVLLLLLPTSCDGGVPQRQRQLQTTVTTVTTPLLADGSLTANLTVVGDDNEKLRVTVTYEGFSYISFAFSLDMFMAGSYAVIGTPADGKVLKYEMTGRTIPTLMPEAQQTLEDTSVTSDGVTTTLTFTKLLKEEGEVEIFANGDSSDNIFLYAVGNDGVTDLHFHKKFGHTVVNLVAGTSAISDPNEYKTLWLVHGLCLAVAWVLLIPTAIACSVARALIPNSEKGMWFQLHRMINLIGMMLTVVGIIVAVYAIQSQQGDTAEHFSHRVRHHQIGLAVLILAMLNAAYGVLRPSAPHAPVETVAIVDDDDDEELEEEDHLKKKATSAGMSSPMPMPHKSPARLVFEYGHRVLGLTAILLAWFNVASGAELLHRRYIDSIADYSLTVWAVVAVVATLTVGLGLAGRSQRRA